MAWLRADAGLGLGEQKRHPGCSLWGVGAQPGSRGGSAAPEGTHAPIPFICGCNSANPKLLLPPPPGLSKSWVVDEGLSVFQVL